MNSLHIDRIHITTDLAPERARLLIEGALRRLLRRRPAGGALRLKRILIEEADLSGHDAEQRLADRLERWIAWEVQP